MNKALGALATTLALLAGDVCGGSLRHSLTGDLPWSLASGEQICDGPLEADREALSADQTTEFAIMADGFSSVAGRTTTAYTGAYSSSVTAERFGANEVNWKFLAKLSTALSTSTSSYVAWLGLRTVGTTQDLLWLMASGPDIYARYYRAADSAWFVCGPNRNTAARLSTTTFKQVNVRVTATELSMTVDGVAACTPIAITGSNAFLSASGAEIAWGPPSSHASYAMIIGALTSPYPRLDSAICGFSGDIQVRYCSEPGNNQMYGLLASQTGEAGALRYERNGALPTDKGNDFTMNFGDPDEDLSALTTLELFVESHEYGKYYAQCIRELLFRRDGKMEPVADFSPGVFVIADKNSGAEIDSEMRMYSYNGEQAWYTVRTVPLSMTIEHPLKTVKLSWRACEVYGAGIGATTKLKVRALVINPVTDRFEYTQWLKITSLSQSAGEVRDNVFWTIERPFTELLFVEFTIVDDTSGSFCLDYVSLDDKPAREMSSSWVANANWRNTLSEVDQHYCGSYGCKTVARAIFEYAICSVEILGATPAGEMETLPVDDENVASAKCSNYNRFTKQSCAISQEISASLSSETTVETGSEYSVAIGQSSSTTKEKNWAVSATVGVEGQIGPVKASASVTAGGGGSKSETSENSVETSSTTSTATGISHAREVSYSVNCEGSAEIPAGTTQGYELRLKKTEYKQQYTTDLKLVYCPETWAEDTDADDAANYRILAGIPSESRLTETMMCEVVFNAPVPLRNAMKCDEEAAETMLNGLDRFVNCQVDDPSKYDGCMCDAMNKLTEDACICVDEGGSAISGTITFITGTWQETCTRMNCVDSKFGDGSGNAVPAPAASSSATGTMMDNFMSAKTPAMIAFLTASLCVAYRAVSGLQRGVTTKKAVKSTAYGAVEV